MTLSGLHLFSNTTHLLHSFSCLRSDRFLLDLALLDLPGMFNTAGYYLLEKLCSLAWGDSTLLVSSCPCWIFFMVSLHLPISMMQFLAHCSFSFTARLDSHILIYMLMTLKLLWQSLSSRLFCQGFWTCLINCLLITFSVLQSPQIQNV